MSICTFLSVKKLKSSKLRLKLKVFLGKYEGNSYRLLLAIGMEILGIRFAEVVCFDIFY